MPQKSPIEWTDYTSNPIQAFNRETGKRGWFCEIHSPGCGHCYAQTLNTGRFGNGLKFIPSNADKVEFRLNTDELRKIRNLSKLLGSRGQKKFLFPFDMTDLFLRHHPDEYLDQFFATVALSPNLIFQVLTKRADRMLEYFKYPETQAMRVEIAAYELRTGQSGQHLGNVQHQLFMNLPNLWLGVSVEDQERADERIPLLLQTPAAKRFVSAEPLLGPIKLQDEWIELELQAFGNGVKCFPSINWLICGGESGPHARPCDLAWIRSIVAQCRSAGVPAFVKQLGSKPVLAHNFAETDRWDLNNRKGGDMSEWPQDLRIREFPEVG